jgi:hypothetical protein
MNSSSHKEKIPPVVLSIADSYFSENLLTRKMATKNDFYTHFSSGFFLGLLKPSCGFPFGTQQQGFMAGQKYRQEQPEKLDEIMQEYGYRGIETNGVWFLGFERSNFYPSEIETDDEGWWLWNLCRFQPDVTPDELEDKGVRLHVRGFLSPPGGYGHLGSCSYQFYALAISKA